jgi:branched-chain amino acid transport system substrate-binding protein
MKVKRTVALGLSACVALILLAWLFFAGRPRGTFKMGAVLPLTGGSAQWGIPPRNAALLAADQVNAAGGIKGKKIVLDIEDDQCEPANAVSAMQKILATSKPIVVLGAVCSSATLAIAPIAESNKVVLISPASTSPLLTHFGNYIFRDIPSDALRGQVFGKYVYARGYRRVSCLYINNDGGLGNEQTFSQTFQSLGGRIVSVDAYPQGTQDVRAQLTKIKGAKPDALLVVSYPDDTPIVLRQAAELKLSIPFFFQTEALDDPAVLQRAGTAAEGVTYILPAQSTGPAASQFAAAYQARYHTAPELYAAQSYDIVMLTARILNASQSLTPDDLANGLHRTQNYPGASGTITFDQNGDVVQPMVIKQIKNLQPVVVSTE